MLTLRTRSISNIKWLLLQLVLLIIVIILISSIDNTGSLKELIMLCWISNCVFAIETVALVIKRGSLLDHVVFFSIIVFLFTFGQSVLFSFGIMPTSFNVAEYTSIDSIVKAMRFAIPAYISFVIGTLLATNNVNEKTVLQAEVGYIDDKAISVGLFFAAVGIVPFLITIINNVYVVLVGGYNYYYTEGVRISNYITFFSYYFYVGLFLLFGHPKRKIRKVVYSISLTIVVAYFLCGDRGTALSLLISAYLLHTYYSNNEQKHFRVSIIVLIVLGLASVSVIDNWRMSFGSGYSFTNIAITSISNNNILFSTLSNLGATIYALAKVVLLIPSNHPYLCGGSYIASFLLLLPSPLRIGFLRVIDSTEIYSSPATWLMKTLHLSYGPGFTPFAEAYLNFGKYGIVAMFIIGFFFAKLFSMKYDKFHNANYSFQIIAFYILAMAARGSFNFVIAFWVRYTIIPMLVLKYIKLTSTRGRFIK